MFTLPILPATIRVPLDPFTLPGVSGSRQEALNFPGCTAVMRPVSLDEDGAWRDRYPLVDGRRTVEAQNALVKAQIIGIEGYGYEFPDGHTEPFDAKNDLHIQSMPQELRGALYLALRERAELPENTSGNSDSPSGSGGTTNTSTSPAEAATSEPATV